MDKSENRLATDNEIQSFLDKNPNWSSTGNSLWAEFKFIDFKEAFAFVSEVAGLAEQLNHHPTWTNTYNRVSIELSTHDLDDKISLLDIELAKMINMHKV